MIFKDKNYAKIYVDKYMIVFGLSNGQYEHSQAFNTKEQCFEFMTKYVFPGAVI